MPIRRTGKASGMKPSDLLGAPFQVGATLRHRRFFHPAGVLAQGVIERLAPPGAGLPVQTGPVIARVSKALGTPGGLPDFAGLAVQMPPSAFAATPWDLLLVSAGVHSGPAERLGRVILRPVTAWDQAPYSSLAPLSLTSEQRSELWWVRARLRTGLTGGLALEAMREALTAGGGVSYDIEQACGGGAFAPLARLVLHAAVPADDGEVAFDPVRHTARGVAVWPEWLRDLRSSAYQGSRDGRSRRPAGQSGGSAAGTSATSGV